MTLQQTPSVFRLYCLAWATKDPYTPPPLGTPWALWFDTSEFSSLLVLIT